MYISEYPATSSCSDRSNVHLNTHNLQTQPVVPTPTIPSAWPHYHWYARRTAQVRFLLNQAHQPEICRGNDPYEQQTMDKATRKRQWRYRCHNRDQAFGSQEHLENHINTVSQDNVEGSGIEISMTVSGLLTRTLTT